MKNVICSIYDSATEAYMRPFTAQTEGQAIRMFQDLVEDQTSEIAKHKEDYSLFKVGTFNDNNATLESQIKCLSRAHEIGQTESHTLQQVKEN